MEFEPFTEEDMTLDPREQATVYKQMKQPKEGRWGPDRGPAGDRNALLRAAKIEEARFATQSAFAEPAKPGLFGRLNNRQFGPALPGLAETQERMVENATSIPKARSLMSRPSTHVTQQNWQRGMGDTFAERNFSPRTRAQGHLLGAAAMFAASMPPPIPRAGVNEFRY